MRKVDYVAGAEGRGGKVERRQERKKEWKRLEEAWNIE